MKKYLLALLFIIICFGVQAEAVSLAVSKIESLGVDADTAAMVEELLQIEFAKNPLFRLVERSKLEALLKEQQLQLSGITGVENAIRVGSLLNINKVIFGTIGLYESEYVQYLLTLRLVDIEKGEIEAAESIEIKSKDEMLKAIGVIVKALSGQVEITGKITAIDEEAVYTSLGEDAGVAAGSMLSVILLDLIKDEAGNVIMREEVPVANLVVEKVSTEGSRCRVLETAGQIETGLTVRRGEVELEIKKEECNLLIKSIPENARVFIDSKFIGLTPVEIAGIKPGSYIIDIRSGAGYKAYRGKVNLKEGRSITIERELEQEIEVEDILLMGKMPRRQTDPATALKKALVPGFGALYNGYADQMPAILFGTVLYGVFGTVIGTQMGFQPYVITQAGNGLLIYLGSLLDAWQTAGENYRYPTYSKLFFGPAGALISEPGDYSAVIGMAADFYYEGRSYSLKLGISPLVISKINTNRDAWLMYMGLYYRFIKSENIFVGLGSEITNNFMMYGDSDGEKESTDAEIPGMLCSPALELSYRSSLLEMDLIASPYTYDTFGEEKDGDHKNFLGFRGRADIDYFFNLKMGAAVSAEYAYLQSLEDDSYTRQFLMLKAGMVMRL